MSDTNSKSLPQGYIIESPTKRYRIISTIGSGGFGITYKASVVDESGRDISGQQFFAIKELFIAEYTDRNPDNTVSFSTKAQKTVVNAENDFIREATMLNRLGTHHPNIVFIHEVFKANNTSYYAMDFLEGETLQDYIKRCGPQPIKWAVKLIAPLFDALACMHANRMTHLDIKPANIIMVERDGKNQPVLIDFGLSKHYDEQGNSTSFVHNIACSKGYAPLEQYAGMQTFTPQADVYALTATLYFCLTGAAPEIASEISPKMIGQALPAQLPEAARSAILRGMMKNKDHRTPSIEALRTDLQKYMPAGSQARKPIVLDQNASECKPVESLDETPDKANGPKQAPHPQPKPRKKSKIAAVIGSIAALLVIGGILAVFLSGSGAHTRKISAAIEQDDEEVLAQYAAMDSTRAIMALAKLQLKNGEFLESARLIQHLDNLGYTTPKLEAIRKQVRNRAYENYNEYMSSNIPSPTTDATEPTVEFAMNLRAEADSTRLLIGETPDSEDQTLKRHSERIYNRYMTQAYNMNYGSPEQIKAYKKALVYRDNEKVREFIKQWE